MWRSAPGFGHGTNMAMRCDLDGSWTPAGAEVFLPLQPNPFFNYSSSLHVSQETCRQMPWTKKGVMSQAMRQRRIPNYGPVMLGTDPDIADTLTSRRDLMVTALRMPMGRPYGTRSEAQIDLERRAAVAGRAWEETKRPFQLYTTCINLAFVMCGIRGWLPGQDGNGAFHLATRGSAIGSRCNPCGACRSDFAWDACWIVKMEYCTLSALCRNGAEVWSRKGRWTCERNVSALAELDAMPNTLLESAARQASHATETRPPHSRWLDARPVLSQSISRAAAIWGQQGVQHSRTAPIHGMRSPLEPVRRGSSRRLLDELWGAYTEGLSAGSEAKGGVLVRVLEWSLVPPWMWIDARERGGAPERLLDDDRAIHIELRDMSAFEPPASLLRWDLPNAIFRGGRLLSVSQRQAR